jgi:serine/threonine protein kinase
MEYLSGVDLMSFIRMQLELSPSDRKYLLSNILMGVRECHEGSVIHRDLKPQNIIVDVHTYQMKIIDFGLSLEGEQMGVEACRSKCGTVGYMAPEVFLKRYSEKCDMFSFGIIAHLILMGSNPLKGRNYEETSLRNQAGKVQLN